MDGDGDETTVTPFPSPAAISQFVFFRCKVFSTSEAPMAHLPLADPLGPLIGWNNHLLG